MKESTNIQPLIKFKVLLIGESCIDRYEFCRVIKISEEAPIPVVRNTKIFEKKGMAANVNLNLRMLGIYPDFVTCTEQIYKKRIVDEKTNQKLLRIDYDPPVAVWNRQLPTSIKNYDAIIISDYNKGFLDYASICYLIEESNGLVFIDTKKHDLKQFYSDRVFVKINELEYQKTTSKPKNLVVTRGSNNVLYFNDGKQVYSPFQVHKQEITDVCGAGDTFLAAFSVNYLQTSNIENAIMFANKASAVTVQHFGNYAPSWEEIDNA